MDGRIADQNSGDRHLEIEEIALSKLRKTKLLKRRHSKDQLDRCVHSVMTFGQYAPLVVSGNEILCGTLVYDALKRLKTRRAKIVQVGELSEEKRRELRYLDNRTFEMSFWKNDDLKVFLMGLDKGFLENCGYREEEVEQMVNGFSEEGHRAKKSLIQELNEQPEEWYCPKCGWTGTFVESESAPQTTQQPTTTKDGNGQQESDGPGEETAP